MMEATLLKRMMIARVAIVFASRRSKNFKKRNNCTATEILSPIRGKS